MVYLGQTIRDNIKILGFYSVFVYVIFRVKYQNTHGVHCKQYCMYGGYLQNGPRILFFDKAFGIKQAKNKMRNNIMFVNV